MRRVLISLGIFAAISLAGCAIEVNHNAAYSCESDGKCPEGLSCEGNLCILAGVASDAAIADGSVTVDAAIVPEADADIPEADADIPEADAALPVVVVVEQRIAAAEDDVEETVADGEMRLDGVALDFGEQGAGNSQLIGLRFALAVPANATILSATIQFATFEGGLAGPTSVGFYVDPFPTPLPFANTPNNLSVRLLSTEVVTWDIPAWAENESGPAQLSPDLKALVQGMVNTAGWNLGNFIVFIIQGTGQRRGISYESNLALAPLLRVEYSVP